MLRVASGTDGTTDVTNADPESAQTASHSSVKALRVENQLHGMMAAIVAYFMFAVMNVFAKILSAHHHVLEIAFYRNLIATLPFLIIVLFFRKRQIHKIRGRRKVLIWRSVIGTISLASTFAAYAVMPMADTAALLFTSSLIVPALAFFLLGEELSVFRWAIISVGFIGVLIMLNPTGDFNSLGVTLALGAAVMQAVLQIMLRGLGKVERPETITFYFLLIGTLVAAVPMPFIFTIPTSETVLPLIGIGICGALAQIFLSIAYKNSPANIMAVFNYTGIIWATAFGWFFWNDWPTMPIWIGGVIVIGANCVMIIREARAAKPLATETQV
jgi:drug/metabolite transporter (DMT)-like permease